MPINSSLSVGGFCQLRPLQVGRCVADSSGFRLGIEARHSEKEPSRGRDGSKVVAWITPAFRVPPLPCLRPYHVKISSRWLIDCDLCNTVWRARRDSNCDTNILAYLEFFAQFWSEGQVEGQDRGRLEVAWSVK